MQCVMCCDFLIDADLLMVLDKDKYVKDRYAVWQHIFNRGLQGRGLLQTVISTWQSTDKKGLPIDCCSDTTARWVSKTLEPLNNPPPPPSSYAILLLCQSYENNRGILLILPLCGIALVGRCFLSTVLENNSRGMFSKNNF